VKRHPTVNTPNTAKFSKIGDYIGIGFEERDVVILAGPGYAVSNTIPNPLGEAIVEIDFSWNTEDIAICGRTKFKFKSFTNAGSWGINNFRNVVSCKLNKADGLGVAMQDGMNDK
jgi:hypothetical protein